MIRTSWDWRSETKRGQIWLDYPTKEWTACWWFRPRKVGLSEAVLKRAPKGRSKPKEQCRQHDADRVPWRRNVSAGGKIRTGCEICGEELILSPTGHEWCVDHTCKNGMGVPLSLMLWTLLTVPTPKDDQACD